MAVREGLNLLGEFEDIVQAGAAQAQGAAVAVLLSESADIYFDPVGTHGSGLRTLYEGARGRRYRVMKKQGAIILGIGGDNSNWAVGTFLEGVMTKGFASDATDAAVHANIATVAAYR